MIVFVFWRNYFRGMVRIMSHPVDEEQKGNGVQIPLALEASLVRVPFESLKRTAKERKTFMDKFYDLHKSVLELKSGTKEELLQKLKNYQEQLQLLSQKFEGCSQSEAEDCFRLYSRCNELWCMVNSGYNSHIEWNSGRLERLILDYVMRCGFVGSADALLHKHPHLTHLVETHIFQGAQRIIQALNNHDCSKALEWCVQNRPKLKKIKSVLEFNLHLQVYLELVRSGQTMSAIMYARKHMASWAVGETQELVQRALGSALFTCHSTYPPYQHLFKEERWQTLVTLFKLELYTLNNMTGDSLLSIHLQGGLSALKNHASDREDNFSIDDPFHLKLFRDLGKDLPMAKHDKSKLLCSVTKTTMNEHNPPQVLPNGYVYSKLAIIQIKKQNDGKIICPQTKEVFEDHDLRQAYIV
eukprot:TRINITY_DN3166_c0_g1_i1.p1 TRINITY_DN3166_c0_g1~~TRINITY_DN3166_c0_g1_i1.p1  ORF type:complete len:413 (-),score=45.12 TRINITY_DN3166_c0_g1_i1:482-1720(-)